MGGEGLERAEWEEASIALAGHRALAAALRDMFTFGWIH